MHLCSVMLEVRETIIVVDMFVLAAVHGLMVHQFRGPTA